VIVCVRVTSVGNRKLHTPLTACDSTNVLTMDGDTVDKHK
jgi:hypothetical protein